MTLHLSQAPPGVGLFHLFLTRTLRSLRVLRRFNCVSIVMPCILVRNSMNMDPCYQNRVATRAFEGTETFIDFSCGKTPEDMNAIAASMLLPLTVITSNRRTSTWSTNHPPSEVLAKLQDLGFSVVAANTVGVTTVWTLQGNLNVRSQSRNRPFRH